jgi:hypothetical protein
MDGMEILLIFVAIISVFFMVVLFTTNLKKLNTYNDISAVPYETIHPKSAPKTYEVAFVRKEPLNVWLFKRKIGENAEQFATDCRSGTINYIMVKNHIYSIDDVKETAHELRLKLSEDPGIIHALKRGMHDGDVDIVGAYNMIYILGYKFK